MMLQLSLNSKKSFPVCELIKVGFNFVEDYPDENGVTWKWWLLKKLEFINQNLEIRI